MHVLEWIRLAGVRLLRLSRNAAHRRLRRARRIFVKFNIPWASATEQAGWCNGAEGSETLSCLMRRLKRVLFTKFIPKEGNIKSTHKGSITHRGKP